MDTRQEFWKRYFKQALPYSEYVQTGSDVQRERWSASFERIRPTAELKEKFESFVRPLSLLVLSGTWCGDCVRQVPMLVKLAALSQYIEVKIIDNQAHPELRDELRIQGGARVPTVVMLSEDFFEVTRFGDRTLSAYRRKFDSELGPSCDLGLVPPSEEELQEELHEWALMIERAELILRLSPMLRERYGD